MIAAFDRVSLRIVLGGLTDQTATRREPQSRSVGEMEGANNGSQEEEVSIQEEGGQVRRPDHLEVSCEECRQEVQRRR